MALSVAVTSGPVAEPLTLTAVKTQCGVDAGFTGDDALLTLYIAAARRYAEQFTHRGFFNQTWRRTLDNFPLAASFDYSPSPADRWNWPVYGGMWNRLCIDLPGGWVQAINAISYTNVDGTKTALTAQQYAADLTSIPCRLTPPTDMVWPWQGSYLPGSVQIEYEVGNYVLAAPAEAFVGPVGNYQYTPKLTPVTKIASLVDASGNSVPYTLRGGTLQLAAAQEGQQLTLNYSVGTLPEDLQAALLLMVGDLYRNRESSTDLNLRSIPRAAEAFLSAHVVEWTDYRPV